MIDAGDEGACLSVRARFGSLLVRNVPSTSGTLTGWGGRGRVSTFAPLHWWSLRSAEKRPRGAVRRYRARERLRGRGEEGAKRRNRLQRRLWLSGRMTLDPDLPSSLNSRSLPFIFDISHIEGHHGYGKGFLVRPVPGGATSQGVPLRKR